MEKECELLTRCGFFTKYHIVRDLGYIQLYCKGPKMNKCERKIYRLKNGTPPTDDMAPSGQFLVNVNIKKGHVFFS